MGGKGAERVGMDRCCWELASMLMCESVNAAEGCGKVAIIGGSS